MTNYSFHNLNRDASKKQLGELTMKRKRFSKEKIVGILKESEVGGKNQEI